MVYLQSRIEVSSVSDWGFYCNYRMQCHICFTFGFWCCLDWTELSRAHSYAFTDQVFYLRNRHLQFNLFINHHHSCGIWLAAKTCSKKLLATLAEGDKAIDPLMIFNSVYFHLNCFLKILKKFSNIFSKDTSFSIPTLSGAFLPLVVHLLQS